MPAIELRHLSHAYGRRAETLRDCSVAIADGSLGIIMGPSGCGKTTLLRIIAGLENPTTGDVLFDAQPVTHLPPEKRDIAFAFQQASLYPHMTIAKNLAFVPRIRKIAFTEINRRIDEAAALLGIEQLLARKPHQLSAGERQRAALAKCFVRRPAIMLLDEPLANLDAHLRAQLRHDIRSVHQQLDCTTICVTHAWAEAAALGDSLVIMSPGRIEQTGTAMDIHNCPATWRAAQIVGDPPMNILRVNRTALPDLNLADVVEHLPQENERFIIALDPAAMSLAVDQGASDSISLNGTLRGCIDGEFTVDTAFGRLIGRQTAAVPNEPGESVQVHLPRNRLLIYAEDGPLLWPRSTEDGTPARSIQ